MTCAGTETEAEAESDRPVRKPDVKGFYVVNPNLLYDPNISPHKIVVYSPCGLITSGPEGRWTCPYFHAISLEEGLDVFPHRAQAIDEALKRIRARQADLRSMCVYLTKMWRGDV